MTTEAYRCTHCGNRTRFDVYATVRRRRFAHFALSGEMSVDEEEVLDEVIDRIVCRWCERDDSIERVPAGSPDGGGAAW